MNAFHDPILLSPAVPPYSLATIYLLAASFPIPNNLNTTSPKLPSSKPLISSPLPLQSLPSLPS